MIEFIINNQVMHQYTVPDDILYQEKDGLNFYKEINSEEKNLIRVMREALFGIKNYIIKFNNKEYFIKKSIYTLWNVDEKIYESIYFKGEDYDFSRRK